MTVSYECKLNFFTFYLHITFIVCIFVVDKRGKVLQNTHLKLNIMKKYTDYLEKLLPFDKVAIKGVATWTKDENVGDSFQRDVIDEHGRVVSEVFIADAWALSPKGLNNDEKEGNK